MSDSEHIRADDEVEGLRKALDLETRRCIDLNSKLERANAEFEEFISMAAHNLREPLRDVVSFSQLMAETYAGRLDSDAGLLLERIQAGGQRMQSLLADVVDYWAVLNSERHASRTDMEAVIRQALLLSETQVAERNAIVTHDALPAVLGDFEILAKVLFHLMRNAIEYCDNLPPRVHISGKRGDPDCVFSVRDNGPGIDGEFQERIFEPFVRMNGNERSGNGLGLSFCKKAIEWHGGRMWVESTPGSGSTFYFTLPPPD